MSPSYRWDAAEAHYVNLRTGQPFSPFVPGVTEPFYVPTEDFSGPRNVGVDTGVELTPYAGVVTNGVATLTPGQTYENILFNCVVDHRGAHLVNCRIVLPEDFGIADSSLNACVRSVNGTETTGGTIDRCEIHNRAQRPFNGIIGRNLTVTRTVITGCVDGLVDSTAGSAPQDFGYVIEDCIVPEVAWWYTATPNSIIHPSDTQSHSDAFQKGTLLPSEVRNSVLLAYISERIGTGTPGSGSETNAYAPATGFNFIGTQSQMETWRATYAGTITEPSQSKYGVAHRLTSSGGSLAAVMVNRDNLTVDHCYFGGGIATLNLLDTNLPSSMNVSITNSIFWNDMKNGHAGNPATKGYAALVTSGKTLTFTNNKWSDGSPVAPNYA